VVRIAPHVARSVWNEGPDDAVLIMCSLKTDDPREDVEFVEDSGPTEGDPRAASAGREGGLGPMACGGSARAP
jgi:hypothetical protein